MHAWIGNSASNKADDRADREAVLGPSHMAQYSYTPTNICKYTDSEILKTQHSGYTLALTQSE